MSEVNPYGHRFRHVAACPLDYTLSVIWGAGYCRQSLPDPPGRGNSPQSFYMICPFGFLAQNFGNALTTSTTPVVTIKEGKVFANSRDVASFFGKNHADVMRAIDTLISEDEVGGVSNFTEAPLIHPQNGQTYRAFDLPVTASRNS